ncbi:MAG: hypothetical protein ACYDCL_12620 [Myxococcales bacterium]
MRTTSHAPVVTTKPRPRCQAAGCGDTALVRCPVHQSLLCPVHFREHALELGCHRLP